jgi:hypothetical protein
MEVKYNFNHTARCGETDTQVPASRRPAQRRTRHKNCPAPTDAFDGHARGGAN